MVNVRRGIHIDRVERSPGLRPGLGSRSVRERPMDRLSPVASSPAGVSGASATLVTA